MSAVLVVGAFLLGVAIVIWSTETLLDGMVGLAAVLRAAPFVIAGLFSGLEAENIAVGVVAAHQGNSLLALGTVFGGASFLVCVALGLGAMLFPLTVAIPTGVLLLVALAPVLAGAALIGGTTSRASGVVLLAAFAVGMWYLVRAARGHDFLSVDAQDVGETTAPRRWWRPAAVTVVGLAVLTLGAELVNYGATGIIAHFAFPAALMGMIIAPAAIEAEEVIRQAVPAKEGRHDVAAGNFVGTLLYFVLFNLGLIAVAAPVQVPHRVLVLDWPFLMAVTLLAVGFLSRGRLTRAQGAVLLIAYGGYVTASILLQR